jgi:hypothetical protein
LTKKNEKTDTWPECAQTHGTILSSCSSRAISFCFGTISHRSKARQNCHLRYHDADSSGHGKPQSLLEAAGYCFKDVVQSTVYLTNMAMFEEFNCEYAKYFESVFPARVTVAVELKAGALVEVSLIAYKD